MLVRDLPCSFMGWLGRYGWVHIEERVFVRCLHRSQRSLQVSILLLGTGSLAGLAVLHKHWATWPLCFQESTYVSLPYCWIWSQAQFLHGIMNIPYTCKTKTWLTSLCLPGPLQGVFFISVLVFSLLQASVVRPADSSWSCQQTDNHLRVWNWLSKLANSEELAACFIMHSSRQCEVAKMGYETLLFLPFYSPVVNGYKLAFHLKWLHIPRFIKRNTFSETHSMLITLSIGGLNFCSKNDDEWNQTGVLPYSLG